MRSRTLRWLMVLAPAAAVSVYTVWTSTERSGGLAAQVKTDPAADSARLLLEEGRRVFRYETFGDEVLWGDTLKLHEAIAGAKLGAWQGTFSDPRLGIDVKHSPAMVSAKLPALRASQHSLPAPPPPAGSFDAAIAKRGRVLFDRTRASCHIGGAGTDNNSGKLHSAAETGVVAHYNRVRGLGLSAEQQRDLVEYLKSL